MLPLGQDDHMSDLQALAADLDQACRLEGEFVLRSGQIATEYFDKYLFESQPALLTRVSQAMAPLIPDGTDLLGGLELGGVPIATAISLATGHPTVFVRKQAKTYGTCRLAEGGEVAGKTVVLVEDVITTGGAVRDAALALREQGAVINVVICAIDRSPVGSFPLNDTGIEIRSVLTRQDLDRANRP